MTADAPASISSVLRPLSAAQVELDRHAAAQRSGFPVDRVVLGRCGLPPLLSPAPRIAGMFRFPQHEDAKLAVTEAGNPINYLPQELVAQRPGESESLWHLRLSIYLMLAGLLDPATGQFVDLLSVNGFEPRTVEGRAEIMRAMRHEGGSRLEDISIDVPFWQQALVDRYVLEATPLLEAGEASSDYDVAVVAEAALARHEKLLALLSTAEGSARAELSTGALGPACDAALRVLEVHAPSVLEDLLAIEVETRCARVPGTDPRAGLAACEEQAQAFAHETVSVAARVKSSTGAASAAEELRAGLGSARARLESASESLRTELSTFQRVRAEREHAASQRRAQQLSAPTRGVDFSGGAAPLP